MANVRLDAQLQAYGRWKADVMEAIHRYRRWLERNHMSSPEEELRLFELIEGLSSDRLTIAFVAEFARGKTELINSIFFSEYDRRLLPSEAGRTTMCPTEMFYDSDSGDAYIRLLPIETRRNETSIAEYKNRSSEWTTIHLKCEDPVAMEAAFREIVRVKRVGAAEARALGLDHGTGDADVEIPVWRHALVSFPHPLFKQGLVLLDTPGLNAIGSEPELTLSILPSAQGVVFVLAADTGTTKSDLEMWNHHVKPLQGGKGKGLLVVLNKVDMLWDELKSEEAVSRTVQEQRERAATTLGVPLSRVFPASAQKGLLAKIRGDRRLLDKSNVPALESVLATEILPQKQALVRDTLVSAIAEMLQGSLGAVNTRLQSIRQQLDDLQALSGKNNQAIDYLMSKTRDEQVAYYKSIESFQANRRVLTEESVELVSLLSLSEMDRLIEETRRRMTDSWTTGGLRSSMRAFFDQAMERLDEAGECSAKLNRLVVTIYRQFHADHGLKELKPHLFAVTGYLTEMRQLYREAEAFRNSPVTAMTEQSFVVRRFFISLVSRSRDIFRSACREAEQWNRSVLAPLAKQIKEQKNQMETRLENLRNVNDSRESLQRQIDKLQRSDAKLAKEREELDYIEGIILRPIQPSEDSPAPRVLVG